MAKVPKQIDESLLSAELLAKVNTGAAAGDMYTKAQVDQKIADIVSTAPANLDTLNELAAALNNDENFASTLITSVNLKVDKVAGKQLSTEDYTTVDKNKVAGIPVDAIYTDTVTTINGKTGVITKADIVALGIPASDTDTVYTHPATHPYSIISNPPTIPTDTNQLAKTDVFTKTEVNLALAGKSDTIHDHDGRYYTETEVNTLLIHNHDTVYAVKATEAIVTDHETRLDNIESGYSEGHVHNNLTVLQGITQLIVDGWNSAVAHISDLIVHITAAERTLWNTVSSKEPSFSKNTAFNKDFGSSAGTVCQGDDARLADARTPLAHNHDTVYYTETEVDAKLALKSDKTYVDTQLATKSDSSVVTGHTGNTTVHVTQGDKDAWNAKQSDLGFTPVNTTDSRLNAELTRGTVQPATGYWFKVI